MIKRFVAASLSVLIAFTTSAGVIAAAATPTPAAPAAGAGQGLEISPPLIDLKLDPGQTLQTQIKLRNVTKETVVTKSQYNDFVAKGEEGQPALLLGNKEKSPYSIKDWLSTVPSVTLAPGEQKTLPITVRAPANASPGGHYGVLRFTAAPPEVDQSAVSLSASIGTLILATVAGNIQEKATLAEVYAARGNMHQSLFEYGPVDLVSRVRNTGNVHLKPAGTVQVTNMFGKEVAAYKLNERGGNILPSSVRKFQNQLNKKWLFGRYTINADVVYGADNKIASGKGSFWVMPYKLIILVIALVVALFYGLRGYNRMIVKRAAAKPSKTPKKK